MHVKGKCLLIAKETAKDTNPGHTQFLLAPAYWLVLKKKKEGRVLQSIDEDAVIYRASSRQLRTESH